MDPFLSPTAATRVVMATPEAASGATFSFSESLTEEFRECPQDGHKPTPEQSSYQQLLAGSKGHVQEINTHQAEQHAVNELLPKPQEYQNEQTLKNHTDIEDHGILLLGLHHIADQGLTAGLQQHTSCNETQANRNEPTVSDNSRPQQDAPTNSVVAQDKSKENNNRVANGFIGPTPTQTISPNEQNGKGHTETQSVKLETKGKDELNNITIAATASPPVKKKRGRPPKEKKPGEEDKPKRKRGRPPKEKKVEQSTIVAGEVDGSFWMDPPPAKRKRGRPPKEKKEPQRASWPPIGEHMKQREEWEKYRERKLNGGAIVLETIEKEEEKRPQDMQKTQLAFSFTPPASLLPMKKRGRPPKEDRDASSNNSNNINSSSNSSSNFIFSSSAPPSFSTDTVTSSPIPSSTPPADFTTILPPKKKRGRPPKEKKPDEEPPLKRKKGRPPKKKESVDLNEYGAIPSRLIQRRHSSAETQIEDKLSPEESNKHEYTNGLYADQIEDSNEEGEGEDVDDDDDDPLFEVDEDEESEDSFVFSTPINTGLLEKLHFLRRALRTGNDSLILKAAKRFGT